LALLAFGFARPRLTSYVSSSITPDWLFLNADVMRSINALNVQTQEEQVVQKVKPTREKLVEMN